MMVDLSDHIRGILRRLGRREGRTPTDILKRSIGFYSILSRLSRPKGYSIAVINAKGKVLQRFKLR